MKKISPPTTIPEKPVFHSFEIIDPSQIPRYQRNLPHLRIQDATYFVTFRLADSIPRSVMEQWQDERQKWLTTFGVEPSLEKKDPKSFNKAYLAIPLFFRDSFEKNQNRRFFLELDKCHGSCVLNKGHKIVAKALEFHHGHRVWLGDYVVMPNHVHVLVQPFPGIKLEEWLYSIKRFASTHIIKDPFLKAYEKLRGEHFWQAESYDRIVRNRSELARMRLYIAKNPAKLYSRSFSIRQMAWLDEFV